MFCVFTNSLLNLRGGKYESPLVAREAQGRKKKMANKKKSNNKFIIHIYFGVK
jgi:hypothetical protein